MTPEKLSAQTAIFSVPIERIVNHGHPLCALADKIDWREFDMTFGSLYDPRQRQARQTNKAHSWLALSQTHVRFER